jgi:DNA topoisomerase-1
MVAQKTGHARIARMKTAMTTKRSADDEQASDPLEMDPSETVRAAGLRYVHDAAPGIHRKRSGRGFSYIGPDGQKLTDRALLNRIKSLGIPPAWEDVWICPQPNGHIQATGRDARGRKQYLYHTHWREARDETKFARLALFGASLPHIRKRTTADLAQPGLTQEKVLATVIQLLDLTLIRIGNEEYARANESYGLTTMRQSQVEVNGSKIQFEFQGKSGKQHTVAVRDPRLARIIRRCEELPGYELFQYVDEASERHSVESSDVNQYLREITGQHFTAKDFRTWGGTVIAASELRELGPAETATEEKKNIIEAVKRAAHELGNTPAVCRRAYIHPAILDAYMEGRLLPLRDDDAASGAMDEAPSGPRWLRPEEEALLAMLAQEESGPEATAR